MEQTLSPRQLARALGVSESSVKRWVDSGQLRAAKTQGGHRRIERNEALRFARELGRPLSQPALLGLGPARSEAPDSSALRDRVMEWLSAGESEPVINTLLGLYVSGASLPALIDGLVTPALEEIGAMWGQAPDAVYVEHRATEICMRAVHQLAALLRESGRGPQALGGGTTGDPYQLPSLCVSICLRAEGFAVTNLGPDVPLEAFEAAIVRQRPMLVWLSVSSELALAAAEEQLLQLSELCARHGATLIAGGRSLPRLRNLRRLQPVTGANMAELSAFARGMIASYGRPMGG